MTAVFGTGDLCACLPTPLTDADREVARRLAERWVAFAKAGDPAVAATPGIKNIAVAGIDKMVNG